MTTNPDKISERLSVLEHTVQALGPQIVSISTALESLSKQVGTLAAREGQTDANRLLHTVLACVGTGLILAGALWGLAIEPVNRAIESLGHQVETNRLGIEQQTREVFAHREAFREIETQFLASGRISNQRAQYNHLLLQLLWSRVTNGESLPSLDYWPEFHREPRGGAD